MYSQLNLIARLNVDCVHLAKRALISFSSAHYPQHNVLSNEQIAIFICGYKIIGDIGKPLRNEVSRLSMKAFLRN